MTENQRLRSNRVSLVQNLEVLAPPTILLVIKLDEPPSMRYKNVGTSCFRSSVTIHVFDRQTDRGTERPS